jgi:thermostable 8-oxoguanine DNA glycosylase
MDQKSYDRKAYSIAYEFLLGLDIPGVTEELIDKYLHWAENADRPTTLSGVYRRLLVSAQNANMRAGVIGGSIGGIENLGIVLCDFDPIEVLSKFPNRWEDVLDEIEKVLKPAGEIRRKTRSIWPKYCQTILSSARFLEQFSNVEKFYQWVEIFYQDELTRAALPLVIQKEIHGIGFALACDFLKELGYIDYAKPDVHLCDIFNALELCPPRSDEYSVFKAIIRVAKNVGASAYNVDKLFWLIGSGYFYNDIQIGNNGRIGRHKAEFIEYAKEALDI